MDIKEFGISVEVGMLMLLSHYGLEDTEDNRKRLIKNAINEFANTFMWQVPVLKY